MNDPRFDTARACTSRRPISPLDKTRGPACCTFRLRQPHLSSGRHRDCAFAAQAAKEQAWQPRLAPYRPLRVATPIAYGRTDLGV